MHENLEVHIGMILIRGNSDIHELLEWLMIQILQWKGPICQHHSDEQENYIAGRIASVTWNRSETSKFLFHARHVRPSERARSGRTVASHAWRVRR